MSIKEKMKPSEHVVLKTNPTKGLEKPVSSEEKAAIKRLMEESKITKAAKVMSPMTDCFLVSSDGRITATKMSLDAAPILKNAGCIVVEADGISMLSYQLTKKYRGEVTLRDMLNTASFKESYNAAK